MCGAVIRVWLCATLTLSLPLSLELLVQPAGADGPDTYCRDGEREARAWVRPIFSSGHTLPPCV